MLIGLAIGVGLFVLNFSNQVAAQAPALMSAEEEAFQNAVRGVSSTVVQIETFGGLERVGDELIAEGPTTGTIVDSEGWIISSLFSFRQQPASILVTLPNGKRAAARIAARDYSRELALLKVEVDEPLPVALFAPKNSVVVGGWTVALGKTYDKQAVSQSVGIISAVDRAYGKAIQTDAKVSPINYGGPLIDIAGRIIGILSPISPGTFLEGDSSQLYDSGIGFAIPIEDIVQRLPSMKLGTDIRGGKLGVVSGDQNELIGPVRISGTAPGSPAAKAKMQAGDVIVEADGKPIKLLAHLKHALGTLDAGQSLTVVVERAGKRITFEPTLTDEIPVYRRRYLGLRMSEATAGLVIDAVEPHSPAAQTSLVVGETITQCNGEPVNTEGELLKFLAVAELDQALQLQVLPVSDRLVTGQSVDPKSDVANAERTGEPRQVEIVATTWPEQIAETMPKIDSRVEEKMPTEIVDVVLGDFPNKAYAIIPPLSDSRQLGLLVVFPEPGELDRVKTQTYWREFCRDYGWIVAVVNSGNARSWSREEVELAGRVIGRLDKTYQIDKARTVIAGLGVGGRIALAAALTESSRVSGAVVVGTELSRFRWPRQNAPLQSTDFLMIGETSQMSPIAKSLSDAGYAVNAFSPNNLDVSKWETLPTVDLRRWLEGLGRL